MCPAAHCTPCQKPCHCEGALRPWQSVIPLAPHLLSCVSDGVLSANSGRKYPKNAVKTKVLKSFRAWRASHADTFHPAYQVLKSTAVLSYRPCAAIRWPLTRTRAALTRQGWLLRLPDGAMWASRPTQILGDICP